MELIAKNKFLFHFVNCHLEKCKCVKFSMPRSNETKICEYTDRKCYLKAANNLEQIEISLSLQAGYSKSLCNCLPLCTSITYGAEVTQLNFDFKNFFKSINVDSDKKYPGLLLARLTIYFRDNEFISMERSEIYGLTDFVANCGGLFGNSFKIL